MKGRLSGATVPSPEQPPPSPLPEFRTLTSATERTVADFDIEMTRVFRNVRRSVGASPCLWVLERSTKSGLVHGHALVPRWMVPELLGRWRLGNVHHELLFALDGLRNVASYIAKDFEASIMPGRRYRSPNGWKPERVDIEADSFEELRSMASDHMRAEPTDWDVAAPEPGGLRRPPILARWAERPS